MSCDEIYTLDGSLFLHIEYEHILRLETISRYYMDLNIIDL